LHCVCDDSNHEMLGMEEIRRKGGAGEKIFRTTSSWTLENASFQHRIWLVLIIELYMEKEKLIPQTDFTEFYTLRTR